MDPSLSDSERMNEVKKRAEVLEEQARKQEQKLKIGESPRGYHRPTPSKEQVEEAIQLNNAYIDTI